MNVSCVLNREQLYSRQNCYLKIKVYDLNGCLLWIITFKSKSSCEPSTSRYKTNEILDTILKMGYKSQLKRGETPS